MAQGSQPGPERTRAASAAWRRGVLLVCLRAELLGLGVGSSGRAAGCAEVPRAPGRGPGELLTQKVQ